MGDLGEQPRAVARNRVGVDGAAVGKRLERRYRALDDVVRSLPRGLRNKSDAAGVVLKLGIIER